MAERQGFEPWVLSPAQRFSRPPRSTTPASLRDASIGQVGGEPNENFASPQAKEYASSQWPKKLSIGVDLPVFASIVRHAFLRARFGPLLYRPR